MKLKACTIIISSGLYNDVFIHTNIPQDNKPGNWFIPGFASQQLLIVGYKLFIYLMSSETCCFLGDKVKSS